MTVSRPGHAVAAVSLEPPTPEMRYAWMEGVGDSPGPWVAGSRSHGAAVPIPIRMDAEDLSAAVQLDRRSIYVVGTAN